MGVAAGPLHCIWTLPDGDDDYSSRWAKIKRDVTVTCGEKYDLAEQASVAMRGRHESTLWQRRFIEHTIRDADDLRRHLDYIHWNPVKHGHVERAMDWPYSTLHRYVRNGDYAADWGGKLEVVPDFSGYE